MIEFRGVTKRYPDGTVAVDELDLSVEAGKITVFVGPSGCGKTTSLRMINRMIEPSGGMIEVDGKDVMSVDAAELRRGIGTSSRTPGSSRTARSSTTSPRSRCCWAGTRRRRGHGRTS